MASQHPPGPNRYLESILYNHREATDTPPRLSDADHRVVDDDVAHRWHSYFGRPPAPPLPPSMLRDLVVATLAEKKPTHKKKRKKKRTKEKTTKVAAVTAIVSVDTLEDADALMACLNIALEGRINVKALRPIIASYACAIRCDLFADTLSQVKYLPPTLDSNISFGLETQVPTWCHDKPGILIKGREYPTPGTRFWIRITPVFPKKDIETAPLLTDGDSICLERCTAYTPREFEPITFMDMTVKPSPFLVLTASRCSNRCCLVRIDIEMNVSRSMYVQLLRPPPLLEPRSNQIHWDQWIFEPHDHIIERA